MVENLPKFHANPEKQYREAKDCIQGMVQRLQIPKNNVSQFIQEMIVKLIAEKHLASIIEARGPRYVPPKRSTDSPSTLPPLTPEQLAAVADRKRQKLLLAEEKKKWRERQAMKKILKNATTGGSANPHGY